MFQNAMSDLPLLHCLLTNSSPTASSCIMATQCIGSGLLLYRSPCSIFDVPKKIEPKRMHSNFLSQLMFSNSIICSTAQALIFSSISGRPCKLTLQDNELNMYTLIRTLYIFLPNIWIKINFKKSHPSNNSKA